MNTYVPFFNDIDTICDSVTWTFYYSKTEYALTTVFRKRVNTLVLQLNEVIKAAVARFGPNEGVYYVDGYQAAYVGHQYCEPAAGPVRNPICDTVYFWHSNWFVPHNFCPSRLQCVYYFPTWKGVNHSAARKITTKVQVPLQQTPKEVL